MSQELYSLTTLTAYLNERFKVKKSGKPFKFEDVQQYIKKGRIPRYLGDITIEKVTQFTSNNAYKLIEKIEKDELGK